MMRDEERFWVKVSLTVGNMKHMVMTIIEAARWKVGIPNSSFSFAG